MRLTSRRRIAACLVGGLLLVTGPAAHAQPKQPRQEKEQKQALGEPWWIYVGTSAGPASKGIYLFRMKTSENPDIPEFVTMTAAGLAAETANPTFLEIDPQRRLLFTVNETEQFQGKKSGAVSAYAVDPATGKLTLLGQRSSGGMRPCHLAVSASTSGTAASQHLLVGNCGSGSVAVLPIAADGKLGDASDVRQHAGKSVHPQRQQGPQVHGVAFSPDNRFAFACDLGLDRVVAYRFDARTGKLTPHEAGSLRTKPGAGPRHLRFRPDGKLAYLINELDSTVTALAYDTAAGTLKEVETLSTVPPQHDGPNRATELAIHPSGKYLMVSNAGHDSVVLFGIDAGSGKLRYIEDQSTYGKTPLHFGMDTPGKHFAVANRDSGNLLILRAPESGRLKPGGNAAKIPAPTCAVFLAATRPIERPPSQ